MVVKSMVATEDEVVLNLMGSDIHESQIVKILNLVRDTKKETMVSVDYLVEEYLECSDYKQSVTTFIEHESPIRRYCAFEVIQDQFDIVDECWLREGNYGTESKVIPALYDSLALKKNANSEDRVRIPKRANFFCKRKRDDSLWVLSFHTWEDADTDLMIFTSQPHEEVKRLVDDIEDFFCEKGPLKGACFNPQWEWIEPDYADWDDVILNEDIRDSIDLNIVTFLDNIKLYAEHGLSTSRGVLLSGLPGTGKTLTMEVLLNVFNNHTRIYAPAETLTYPEAINETYKLARKLSPTLVIIEDIDTLGRAEDHHDRSVYVSQLLSSLNSAESNESVITIASTNYPQALDIALRDRPGRFDSRINFPLPNKKERELILRKYSTSFKVKDLNWKTWAKKTEEFTGAWLRELITVAFSLAVRKQKSNKSPVLNNDYMEQAFSIVHKTRSMVNLYRESESESENLFM
jgi:hypothetical protein